MAAGEATFLDTSGVLAVLDADDAQHATVAPIWQDLLAEGGPLVMTDYVRLELWSLAQRRLGLAAVEDLSTHLLPRCRIETVGEAGFDALSEQILLARRRDLSLVDLASFRCMRKTGLRRALAFDKHFEQQGFITPGHPQWRSASR